MFFPLKSHILSLSLPHSTLQTCTFLKHDCVKKLQTKIYIHKILRTWDSLSQSFKWQNLLISDFDFIFVVHVAVADALLDDVSLHPAVSLRVAATVVACQHICGAPEPLTLHPHPHPYSFRRAQRQVGHFDQHIRYSVSAPFLLLFLLPPFGGVRAPAAAAVLPQQGIHVRDGGRVHLRALGGQPARRTHLLAFPGQAVVVRMAVDQAEHFAHQGGAKVKGEGVQGGEGGQGVGVGCGGRLGVHRRRAGAQDDIGGVGQRAPVDVWGAGGGQRDGGLLPLGAGETRKSDKTRFQTWQETQAAERKV